MGESLGLESLLVPAPSSTPLCQVCPWYLAIEHHCGPVVLLFLQDKDNVSWQDLQLLSGLGDELVQDTVRLPFEGPRFGSHVRRGGGTAVLLHRGPELCFLVSLVLSLSPLLVLGASWALSCGGAGQEQTWLCLLATLLTFPHLSSNLLEDFWCLGPGWRTRGL